MKTYLDKEDVFAVHVRDTIGQGADDEEDVLPYAQDNNLVIVTSDVTDRSTLPPDSHAEVVLLYDDTMPAYRVAAALLRMVDAYPSRDEFAGREELDAWV